MTEQCKVCETVQAWGDGTHRCMICRKLFIAPVDICPDCPCAKVGQQQPVDDIDKSTS